MIEFYEFDIEDESGKTLKPIDRPAWLPNSDDYDQNWTEAGFQIFASETESAGYIWRQNEEEGAPFRIVIEIGGDTYGVLSAVLCRDVVEFNEALRKFAPILKFFRQIDKDCVRQIEEMERLRKARARA